MKKEKIYFYFGIAVLILLGIFYFIDINLENGQNYSTRTRLLGILIFYNPFILALYILIALILIAKGFKERNKKSLRQKKL